MRKQNSRKGRPRKVIRQGKANLSFTGKAVTSHAGMALVSRALDYFHVCDDHRFSRTVNRHNRMRMSLGWSFEFQLEIDVSKPRYFVRESMPRNVSQDRVVSLSREADHVREKPGRHPEGRLSQ